jgi:hypothetical protein
MILSLETICFADCLSCLQICQAGGVSLRLILDSPFKTHNQDSILPTCRQEEEFAALIRLEKPLVTNCLLKNNAHYEKSNHTWFCALNRWLNVGLLFE